MYAMSDRITLCDGNTMPTIGLGCFLSQGNDVYQAIQWAAEAGYRMIDTAAYYKNEVEVGKGIRDCGVPREELFVVTKIWPLDYDKPVEAIQRSLDELNVGYVDGFLMHWPHVNASLRYKTWEALLAFQQKGLIRSVGVSNFLSDQLDDLIDRYKVTPIENQIELHPWLQERALCRKCRELGIAVAAWAPIMRGHLGEVKVMDELAEKYGRSPAQLTLRWHLQHGHVIIPKSTNKERIKSNTELFDFAISEEDMQIIDDQECGRQLGRFHPETFVGKE